MKINIAVDFTKIPGPRYMKDGRFSGEDFRNRILVEKYDESKRKGEKLVINFDGGYGYPPSFLEEAFGGLVRLKPKDRILDTLDFISNEEPGLIDDVKRYIENAQAKDK